MTQDSHDLLLCLTVSHLSEHKDEVRSMTHGYFQSRFRVSTYMEDPLIFLVLLKGSLNF
jgi:hypothetical protein